MAHGGKRKNAGRRKGGVNRTTLEKQTVLAELRQRTMQVADKLWNAQFSKAVGSMMIYRVDEYEDKNGKKKREHILIEDAEEIKQVLDETDGLGGNTGENFYIVTTRPPDNKAIDSMLDRTFGKAQQTIEIETPKVTQEQLARELMRRLIVNRRWSQEKALQAAMMEFPAIDLKALESGEK